MNTSIQSVGEDYPQTYPPKFIFMSHDTPFAKYPRGINNEVYEYISMLKPELIAIDGDVQYRNPQISVRNARRFGVSRGNILRGDPAIPTSIDILKTLAAEDVKKVVEIHTSQGAQSGPYVLEIGALLGISILSGYVAQNTPISRRAFLRGIAGATSIVAVSKAIGSIALNMGIAHVPRNKGIDVDLLGQKIARVMNSFELFPGIVNLADARTAVLYEKTKNYAEYSNFAGQPYILFGAGHINAADRIANSYAYRQSLIEEYIGYGTAASKNVIEEFNIRIPGVSDEDIKKQVALQLSEYDVLSFNDEGYSQSLTFSDPTIAGLG